MKITIILVGKTDREELSILEDKYYNRLKHYTTFNIQVIPDLKNTKNWSENQIKEKEGEKILAKLQNSDTVILLDEKGKSFTSVQLAKWVQNHLHTATKHLVFVIGGAYGFDEKLQKRANGALSLSKLTFSHQMVRIFFLEQVYRAFTIIRGEPYHHY